MSNKTFYAFCAGVCLPIVASLLWSHLKTTPTHPIGYADSEDEVHVHSDFIVYLAGEQYDFTADQYQTTSEQEVHAHIHLHDNVGHIIHRHDHNVLLTDFMSSLGFALSEECITSDQGEVFCSNETNQLLLFVNGELTNIANYESHEEDRILIYYGDPDSSIIADLNNQITDEACIYSGTCPERGIAPPESCGLTCEI